MVNSVIESNKSYSSETAVVPMNYDFDNLTKASAAKLTSYDVNNKAL